MWCHSSAKLLLIFISFEYIVSVSSVEPDVCATATNIGSYKRSIAYVLGPVETPQCDQSIENDAWYSFDAPTGGEMPETCIQVYYCGSNAPIWMNGTHPTAENPGPLTRTICAQKTHNGPCCDWTNEIKVKWCQNATTKREHFVYQLKRPSDCSVSYCAGDRVKCNANCAWNDVISNCSCPAYPPITPPVLNDPFISTKKSVTDPRGNQFIATKFSISCTVGYAKQQVDDGARFLGVLESNGRSIGSVTGTSLEPVLIFEESFLHGYLGTNITCRVSSYWLSNDPLYDASQVSNSKWFGLLPVTESGQVITSAVIKDGEVFPFKIWANFPITSPKCFTNPPGVPCHSIYTFQISASNAGRICDCRFSLTPFKNASDLITVSPTPVIGTRTKPFIWEIAFENQTYDRQTSDTIFEGYTIPSIKVEIEDSGTRPLCSSTGDPHITTFPSGPSQTRLYYNIYLSGDFSFVNATTRLFQIQVRHYPCTSTVTCNCGVMIREGNNILGIDSCLRGESDSTPRLIRYLLDQDSPGGEIETTGSGWTIMMLSGVQINVDRGYKPGVLDIHVIGLSSDIYSGLCSYKGAEIASCTIDCEKYRIRDEDSFFNFNSSNIPKCFESYVVPTCECNRRDSDNSIKVTCSHPNQSNLLRTSLKCELPEDKKLPIPQPPVDDNDTVHVNPDDLIGNKSINDKPFPPVVPVWPTPINKINETYAKQVCNEALVNSTVYEICREQKDIAFELIISGCVQDIQLADDLSPARSVHAQLERICDYSFKNSSNVTSNDTDSSNPKSDELQEHICPNQCSNRGKCVKSSCVCESGYVGSDCYLPKGYVPSIKGLLSPVCFISADMNCGKIFVETTDVLSGYNVSCQIRNSANRIRYDSAPVVSGGVIICSLSFDLSPGTYNVSISIDGQTYSPDQHYIIVVKGPDFSPPTVTTAKDTSKVETTSPTKPPVDGVTPGDVRCVDLTGIWELFQQFLQAMRNKKI